MSFRSSSLALQQRLEALKMMIMLLGLLTLVVGYYTYLDSDWQKQGLYDKCRNCSSILAYKDLQCPNIGLEVFHIMIITLAFTFSFSFVMISCFRPNAWDWIEFKALNVVLDIALCLLLLVSSFTFMVSAIQIDRLFHNIDESIIEHCEGFTNFQDMQLLGGGKLVAGLFAWVLAALHAMAAFLIHGKLKSDRNPGYPVKG